MDNSARELCYLTITEASRRIKGRELSPVELTRAHLDRIVALDGRLQSFVTVLADAALAEARAAEAEILKGRYRGPLHGIPVAHKDQYDVRGVPTGIRPENSSERKPSQDATAVLRLREAGSVLLGKLVMFGLAVGEDRGSVLDEAHNPWNLKHSAGGSSSGSGAGVAAGLCMGSLGEDTAGSIRIPAAYCGIVGLKPTYGRVSRRGLVPLSWSLDHGGPMTRTVEDNALLLQVVAGYDPNDPTSCHVPVPNYSAALREDVKGLIIGVPRDYISAQTPEVEPETLAAFNKALTDLESLGARIEDVRIPSLDYASASNIVIWFSEAFAVCKTHLRTQPRIYGDLLRTLLYMGSLFDANDYIQAQRARSRIRREFAVTLQEVDVLALPVAVQPAPPYNSLGDIYAMLDLLGFLAPFNVTGTPAISIPCGFNSAGLPIGLQIAGKAFDEPTVLRVAYAYQQHAGWHQSRPPI